MTTKDEVQKKSMHLVSSRQLVKHNNPGLPMRVDSAGGLHVKNQG
jgi:hypothetical protein